MEVNKDNEMNLDKSQESDEIREPEDYDGTILIYLILLVT